MDKGFPDGHDHVKAKKERMKPKLKKNSNMMSRLPLNSLRMARRHQRSQMLMLSQLMRNILLDQQEKKFSQRKLYKVERESKSR